jgi:hypothetical protein
MTQRISAVIIIINKYATAREVPRIERVHDKRSAGFRDNLVGVSSEREASKHMKARNVMSSTPLSRTYLLFPILQIMGKLVKICNCFLANPIYKTVVSP